MNEKTCKLPEIEKLKELLRDAKNIVWYMRCPEVIGPKDSLKYLKDQIKQFRSIQSEK